MAPDTQTFEIPRPLKVEHEELHAQLARATKEVGDVGAAAREVARILHPHFVSEEEFALPPLGLLRSLAAGTIDSNMKPAIAMAHRLKSELPRMLEEHQTIVAALHTLIQAATRRDRPEIAFFAEKLRLHAQTEEEVLYPAAMLVGEFLEAHLKG